MRLLENQEAHSLENVTGEDTKMKISRRQLKRLISENLLLEFSAAGTGIVWQNVAQGMGGAVSTHGRSLLQATQAFTSNTGTVAADFASRAGSRAVMNHNMRSLTTAINRAGGESAFNAVRAGMGTQGEAFAWQGGQMVYTGGQAGEVATVFGSGVTAGSVAIFLAAVAAAAVVPGVAYYTFSTMDNLDQQLRTRYRYNMDVSTGENPAFQPFSSEGKSGNVPINKKQKGELIAILPLIFQGFGKGENAILRDKARLPLNNLGSGEFKADPNAIEMGNKIIKLINDKIVSMEDLSNKYYETFIKPIIKERKKAQAKIKESPAIPDEGPVNSTEKDEEVKPTPENQAQKGKVKTSDITRKIQKIVGAEVDGKFGPATDKKLRDFAGLAKPTVVTKPEGLKWWTDWKNSASQIKSITVITTEAQGNEKAKGRTMSFGTAANPQLRGNLSSLLKVVEFIDESRKNAPRQVSESLSHGALIRKRYWGRY